MYHVLLQFFMLSVVLVISHVYYCTVSCVSLADIKKEHQSVLQYLYSSKMCTTDLISNNAQKLLYYRWRHDHYLHTCDRNGSATNHVTNIIGGATVEIPLSYTYPIQSYNMQVLY